MEPFGFDLPLTVPHTDANSIAPLKLCRILDCESQRVELTGMGHS
jgi:hypothetical protein